MVHFDNLPISVISHLSLGCNVHRYGLSSIPELELMGNSGIGIAYLKKRELINLELKFAIKHQRSCSD